jgi:hypothetical protein
MTLEPADCRMTQLVLKTITCCLNSPDKLEITTALEALGRLCQMDINEDALCAQLEDAVYEQMVSLLTLHDIQIVVAVLEALYQLSELGSITTTHIAQVRAAVSILVNLLTLEVQAYGPESMAGAKVVEHVVVSGGQQLQQTPTVPVPNNMMGPPLRPPTHPQQPQTPVRHQLQPSLPPGLMHVFSPSYRAPLGPSVNSSIAPHVASTLATIPPLSVSTPGIAVTGSSILAVDCEAAACNWLKSQFEYQPSAVNCRISRMDLYRRYLSMLGVHGLQNIVSPSTFAACIRVAFPSVDMENSSSHEGNYDILYHGIVPRSSSLSSVVGSDKSLGPFSTMPASSPQVPSLPMIRAPIGHPLLVTGLQNAPSNCPSIQQALLGAVPASSTQAVDQSGNTMMAGDSGTVKTLATDHAQQLMRDMRTPLHDNATSVSVVPLSAAVSVPSSCGDSGDVKSRSLDVFLNHVVTTANHVAGTTDCDKQVKTAPVSATNCSSNLVSMTNGKNSTASVGGDTPSTFLANGHATTKLGATDMTLTLVNGINSPVPSCSSDDLDPVRELKQQKVAAAEISEADSGSIVTNGMTSHDGDNDDDSSDLNDVDDVLCKAMIHADIIDGGGRPAITDDDDSQLSADFLSGFLATAAVAETQTADSNPSYDVEAAAAVADLLNDSGMSPSGGVDDSSKDADVENTVVDSNTASSLYGEQMEQAVDTFGTGFEVEGDVAESSHLQSNSQMSQAVIQQPTSLLIQQPPGAQLGSGPARMALAAGNSLPIPVPVAPGMVPATNRLPQPPGGLNLASVSTPASSLNNILPMPGCGATNTVGRGQPVHVSTASIVPTSTQLQNSVMIVPQGGITLPSGQFVTGGTRLLIRSTAAIPQFAGATPVQWNRPAIARIQLPTGVTMSMAPGATSHAAGVFASTDSPASSATFTSSLPSLTTSVSLQLSTSNIMTPAGHASAVQFVSATTSQGQVVIQRAQQLGVGSQTAPVIQRVLLPSGQRPIVIQRPDCSGASQAVMQQGQPGGAVRPVLLSQRPLLTSSPAGLGQLRLTGHTVQLVAGSAQQPSQLSAVQPTQILLQRGQLLNGPGASQPTHGPWIQTSSGQVHTEVNPIPTEHVSSSQDGGINTTQQPSHTQPSQIQVHLHPGQQMTNLQPGQMPPAGLRPLFNTGQQPIQLLGNAVQLRSGLVQTSSGGPVIFQQGTRQILIQPSNMSVGQQRAPGYVLFRQGLPVGPAVTMPEVTRDGTMEILGAVTSNSRLPLSLGSTVTASTSASSVESSRKRPAPAPLINTRSLRKKKKEEDCAYVCEWIGCNRGFDSFIHIYQHVTKEHFEDSSCAVQTCRWSGCDSLPRQRWSFMTHLQDRHLNEASLRLAAEQRRRNQDGGGTATGPSNPQPTPPPVYPPNAALQAIRRFSARPPFPELMDPVEGPLTKHIHLTSALILRNLARYSSLGRSLLKRHEQLLAYIALSSAESSLPISHCLQDLHMH